MSEVLIAAETVAQFNDIVAKFSTTLHISPLNFQHVITDADMTRYKGEKVYICGVPSGTELQNNWYCTAYTRLFTNRAVIRHEGDLEQDYAYYIVRHMVESNSTAMRYLNDLEYDKSRHTSLMNTLKDSLKRHQDYIRKYNLKGVA